MSGRGLPAVLRAIGERGPLTFADFMRIALADPETGYYTSAREAPTRTGDFLTAPELHPIFGAAVGRQLHEAWEQLGRPAELTLVEYGAGAGTLALAILAGLRADGSGLADAVRYAPLELNPHRRRDLAERAAAAGLPLVEPRPGSVGVVLANEFLDALPVHLLEQRDGRLREIRVAAAPDGTLREVPGEPADPALTGRLASLRAAGVALADGQRLEICLELDAWAADVSRLLARGLVLVIDYGAVAPDLYGPRHGAGTLMTYRDHVADGAPDAPYREVGERDITAHVDFTALAVALTAAGFAVDGITTQARFLAACGLEDLLERERAGVTTLEGWLLTRSAIMRLLDPRHLGVFRVLLAGRGLPARSARRGLAQG